MLGSCHSMTKTRECVESSSPKVRDRSLRQVAASGLEPYYGYGMMSCLLSFLTLSPWLPMVLGSLSLVSGPCNLPPHVCRPHALCSGNDFDSDGESDASAYAYMFETLFPPPTKRPKIVGYIESVVHEYSDEEFRRNFRLPRSVCDDLISRFEESAFYPDMFSR
ncbi:hypothetical protein HPB47_004571 [Ixodes persulcatus]|uniref:Uncharacterized protein n=1 Tax=Ixodes persulcatus TaxID=34615 RepID=A0AC60PGB9_IXOPE|nr:hypothetical protein HPB47_004571 [Ixodes persulcatus]